MALPIGRRSGGTSMASISKPSGSIQSPRIGRKLNTPPAISSSDSGTRTSASPGRRTQRRNPALTGICRAIRSN